MVNIEMRYQITRMNVIIITTGIIRNMQMILEAIRLILQHSNGRSSMHTRSSRMRLRMPIGSSNLTGRSSRRPLPRRKRHQVQHQVQKTKQGMKKNLP